MLYIVYTQRTHMQDLKDITQDIHYENFRKKKLLQGGGVIEDGTITVDH